MKTQIFGVRGQDGLINKGLLFATMCILTLGLWMPQANAQAIPGVIIDEDMSSDHDDLADLAMCDAMAYLGKIKLLACMVDSTNGATALCMNAINTYYGFPLSSGAQCSFAQLRQSYENQKNNG